MSRLFGCLNKNNIWFANGITLNINVYIHMFTKVTFEIY